MAKRNLRDETKEGEDDTSFCLMPSTCTTQQMYQRQPRERFGMHLCSCLVFAAALFCCGWAALSSHLSEGCMLSVGRH